MLFERHNDTEVWQLSDHESLEGERRLPVKNPAKYTAEMLYKFCRLHQIQLAQPQPGIKPVQATVLSVHESSPLIELVERTLEYSNNLMAELIQMTAARHYVSRSVGIEEASQIQKQWLTNTLSSVDWRGFEFINGSGLNSQNRITPEQLVEVLDVFGPDPFLGRTYQSLLPVSGWKGSLSQQLTDPDVAFRVWAKPGAMNYVYTLAGYLFTSEGERLIFAIMLNNLGKRAIVDATLAPLADEITRDAQEWSNRAIETFEATIRGWISNH